MLFNTFAFAVFFILVYGLYLLLDHRRQNQMLLTASYVFYGAWDAVFLSLIFVSTILDYLCALRIAASDSPRRRKLFLGLSIAGNLGILGYFKYADFFATELQSLLTPLGIHLPAVTLDVVLPVGISFYTFQTMSYTIDVYRGRTAPVRSIFDFALYVAFFPQLVAGPIERAGRLLPQILNPRRVTFHGFSEGMLLIGWGLFQKVFVADNLARIADPVFASSGPYTAPQVLWAVYAFTIQIYCDFAGYSNIARGLARCLGFHLMRNFDLPYFSTNPRELWRRWHISLSTWIRDYLFHSLGGYRRGGPSAARNVLIAFALAGLWHGANWTFVVWGLYHGVLLIVYILLQPVFSRVPSPPGPLFRRMGRGLRIVGFFHLFCLGALIFRAGSIGQAGEMLTALGTGNPFDWGLVGSMVRRFLFFSWVLLGVELLQWRSGQREEVVLTWPTPVRAAFYLGCFYLFLIFGVQGGRPFYYFQF